jgi:hypothetical protein
MGKAANRKRNSNQATTAQPSQQIQGSEMTQVDILQSQINATYAYLDLEADDELTVVELTNRDIALSQGLLVGITCDDVVMIDKFVTLLPTSNLTLDSVSFYDSDTDQAYSMLGFAKALSANRVAAYLMSRGLNKDFIGDQGTLH